MKIDANKVYAALAFDGTNAVPLKVDPTTGRVLAKIYAENTTVDGAEIKRDENHISASLAVDSNDKVRPLTVSDNNYLYIDNE